MPETLKTETLKPGGKVGWGASGGEKKVASATRVKGCTAKAAKENPQFVVKPAKSGKTAVRKPDDLKRKWTGGRGSGPPHPGWDFARNRGMIVAML